LGILRIFGNFEDFSGFSGILVEFSDFFAVVGKNRSIWPPRHHCLNCKRQKLSTKRF
jgi:hypothetical protein